MGFRSTLSTEEQDKLIQGKLREQVIALLKRREQTKAIDLVRETAGVSIIDAIPPVNRLYAEIDPAFAKSNGKSR